MSKPELLQLLLPSGAKFDQPQVVFHILDSIEIAAAIEVDLSRSIESINEIAAVHVGRENLRLGRQLRNGVTSSHGELIGRKTSPVRNPRSV